MQSGDERGERQEQRTRLFLEPGVLHCGGGPGVNSFDMVAALDAWVTGGPAADADRRGQGRGAERPGRARPCRAPVCAYPRPCPATTGKGDANRAGERSVCR